MGFAVEALDFEHAYLNFQERGRELQNHFKHIRERKRERGGVREGERQRQRETERE